MSNAVDLGPLEFTINDFEEYLDVDADAYLLIKEAVKIANRILIAKLSKATEVEKRRL